MNTIGERIKYLRQKHKVTQTELADGAKIQRGNISHYEKGDWNPNYDTTEKIANFFKVDPDWLYYGNSNKFKEENIPYKPGLEKAKDLSNEAYADGNNMTSKDKKTLAKVIEDALGDVMLSTNNDELSDEDIAIVANAIKYAFVMMKKDQKELKNKRKKDK
jgi:transcriptional regulator with XRE-family HTH domain